MEKMIMIPEWRYNKMIENYDRVIQELQTLREQLQIFGEGDVHVSKD